jgi:hypothetical protein
MSLPRPHPGRTCTRPWRFCAAMFRKPSLYDAFQPTVGVICLLRRQDGPGDARAKTVPSGAPSKPDSDGARAENARRRAHEAHGHTGGGVSVAFTLALLLGGMACLPSSAPPRCCAHAVDHVKSLPMHQARLMTDTASWAGRAESCRSVVAVGASSNWR